MGRGRCTCLSFSDSHDCLAAQSKLARYQMRKEPSPITIIEGRRTSQNHRHLALAGRIARPAKAQAKTSGMPTHVVAMIAMGSSGERLEEYSTRGIGKLQSAQAAPSLAAETR